MTQVFISYSRRDKKFVERLSKDLEGKGYEVWFDLTDIEGGDRWAREIQKGIQESDYFIIVVSENSIKSEWVEKEYIYASSRGLPIIPILLEECDLPIWLMNIQYIEILHRRTYEEGFQQIISVIDGVNQVEKTPEPETRKPKLLWAGIGEGVILLGVILLGLILWGIFGMPPEEIAETQAPTATKMNVTPTRTPILPPEATPTFTPAIPTLTPTPNVAETETQLSAEITDETGAEMALVPAGNFLMGSDRGAFEEKPAHIVTLSDFYIDRFEVTNTQYFECFNDNFCEAPSNTTAFYQDRYSDHPVVFVDWAAAVNFCAWRGARLPTEEEWEKAARGSNRFDYPWGNEWNNKYANGTGSDDKYVGTSPVKTFEDGLSPYGLYHMAGNVWEWTADWYGAYPGGDANGSTYFGELHRVVRGGSWGDNKNNLLTYRRNDLHPDTYTSQIGFRCAKDIE